MSKSIIYDSIDRAQHRQIHKQGLPPTLVSSLSSAPIIYIDDEREDIPTDTRKWLFTLLDKDILQLEQILHIALQNFERLMENRSELEIPEVFELQPLSSRRTTIKVRERRPAPFYFVDNE